MSGKEFFQSVLLDFFIIVTLVTITTYLLGSKFMPDAAFGYEAFLSPLIYGFFGLIPEILMYSKKELSVRQVLFRKTLQLVSIEVLLYFLAFRTGNPQKDNVTLQISFCISVFIIYILVHVILWLLDVQTAKKMTLDLQKYQKQA